MGEKFVDMLLEKDVTIRQNEHKKETDERGSEIPEADRCSASWNPEATK